MLRTRLVIIEDRTCSGTAMQSHSTIVVKSTVARGSFTTVHNVGGRPACLLFASFVEVILRLWEKGGGRDSGGYGSVDSAEK